VEGWEKRAGVMRVLGGGPGSPLSIPGMSFVEISSLTSSKKSSLHSPLPASFSSSENLLLGFRTYIAYFK
jgi:hypothetical protein